jgi:hypothetical protein
MGKEKITEVSREDTRHRLTQMKNYKWHEITEKIIGAAYKVHNTPVSGFFGKGIPKFARH